MSNTPSDGSSAVVALIGGILAAFVINFVGFYLILFFGSLGLFGTDPAIVPTVSIVLTILQIVWMTPIIRYMARLGHAGLARGLIVGCALTCLLNVACGAVYELPKTW